MKSVEMIEGFPWFFIDKTSLICLYFEPAFYRIYIAVTQQMPQPFNCARCHTSLDTYYEDCLFV